MVKSMLNDPIRSLYVARSFPNKKYHGLKNISPQNHKSFRLREERRTC